MRDQGVDDDPPGGVVVGVEAVPRPGVVAEQDVGSQPADPEGDLGHGVPVGDQVAVDPAQEGDLAGGAQGGGRVALLGLPGGDQGGGVGLDVPGPLGPVGAHQDGDLAAGLGPAGQRGPRSELDVVRVRPHRQRPRRHLQLPTRDDHGRAPYRRRDPCRLRGDVASYDEGSALRGAGGKTDEAFRGLPCGVGGGGGICAGRRVRTGRCPLAPRARPPCPCPTSA